MVAGAGRSAKGAGHPKRKGAEVKKRPAKKAPKKKGPSENEIHMKAWVWVQKTYPALLIFHVANERKAAPQYHIKLRRLGVLKGVADFLAFPVDGRKFAIELKDDEGVQDEDQVKFQRRWEHAGGLYFLVRTVTDFQNIVDGMMLFG
jgi:hypothetical protein